MTLSRIQHIFNPTMHNEIDDLRVKYERMEMEIGVIKRVLKVPVDTVV
ncbi:MAG: hypothetical protein GW779_04465 [Candidatus Altiarchaeum hamiconexum]|uniref:Uncharacterized protein n=1 Tax=Candidatus Altarchaeum hamiconexum TaxID=1803513 RepID=A0A8J7YV36_9ARCH|nr:hypothetical protein [Candidatus Altarchaeum hamiconexum]NCS91649.1 hypothetical protein [Candidatus Altarchaeum hamiconexum]NCT00433.1 hypothetical protein [Candidatus Altarchaeum hamiconexum]